VAPAVITLRATNRDVLLTADLLGGSSTAASTELPIAATEVPAAFQMLLVDAGTSGNLLLRRHDVAGADVETIVIESPTAPASPEAELWFRPELSAGHAQRLRLSATDYDRLLKLGRCTERNVRADTKCLEDLLTTLPGVTPRSGMSTKDAVTDRIYAEVSGWLGRVVTKEFTHTRLASTSEPIVLFIGLSGVNRAVLLDCQGLDSVNDNRECTDYARVSARTLERATHIWVAYLEDEDVPFSTTIDVEVSGRGNAAEYDEFDPRVARRAPLDPTKPNEKHVIRLGFRRFRLPDRPVAVQVAFSRQGAGYGLRQWVWTYQKYSRSPVAVAVGPLMIPVPVITQRGRVDASEDETRRFVFGTVSMRFPQWRGKGYDQSRGRSLLYFLTPGITFGVADSRTFMLGGSVLVPVAGDRVGLAGGLALTRDPEAHSTASRTCSFKNLCPLFGITIDLATFR
jgi:hypothetical protein